MDRVVSMRRQRKTSYVICDRRGAADICKEEKTRKKSYVLCRDDNEIELRKIKDTIINSADTDGNDLYLIKVPCSEKSLYEFPAEGSDVKAIMSFMQNRNKRRNAVCEEMTGNLRQALFGYMTNKFISESILLN